MRTLYVDTGAFLAIVLRRDAAHERVSDHFRQIRADRDRLITSDAAIGETFTRLRYAAGVKAVRKFRSILNEAMALGALEVRNGTEALRKAALDLMVDYEQTPLAYADCVGAVVARQARADAVFGLDNDFRILGFAVEP